MKGGPTSGNSCSPPAPGWEAEVVDPLLREDIAEAACGDPARRLQTAAEFAARLTNLERRRAEREELARAEQRAQLAERRRAHVRARLPWLVLAVVALVAAAALISFRRSPPPAPAPRVKAVAVLPFQNVGSDPSLDYLSLALSDEIATTLSRARGLAVRPFATTRKYTQANLDLQQAGREMGVDGIVTGHFMQVGEQLRVTLEAVDVETNEVLWSDKMEAPARSMIATQVQIALRVQRGLAPAFGASDTKSPAKPKNEQAYDLYLRGKALAFDLKSIREAIQLLEKSVTLNPDYAPAWYDLGIAYSREAHYAGGGRGSLERSDAANDRALALDPDNILAHITRISNRVERGDLVRAYQEAEDLVRRRPDHTGARFSLMYVLRYAGLLEESARQCDAAFALDSKTPSLSLRSCAMVFLLQGDYARASNFLSNYGNHLSGSDYATAISIGMLVRQGKEQEALQLGLTHTPKWAGYGLLLACMQGRPAPEISALAQSMQPSDDPEWNYLIAGHLAYCGQSDAALEMLRRAVKGNYCSYPAMDSDPLFTTLRARPEFAEIRTAAIECRNNFLAQRGQPPQ